MNELEQNYLAHHGILGQKWHKRNGPPYPLGSGDHSKSEQNAGWKKSLGGGRNEELYDRKTRKRAAKEATEDLNRNDQEISENRFKYNKAKQKFEKYERKVQKAKEGSKKREKYAGKALDAWLDSEEAREAIDEGLNRTKEILGYLEENGFDVQTKDTMRSVNRGENAVKSMITTGLATGLATAIAGPAGLSGATAAIAVTRDKVKGTKFKVIEPKKKKEKVEESKKESMFDQYERKNMEQAKNVLKDRPSSTKEEILKSTSNIIKENKNNIAKSMAREMVSDMVRWNKEDPGFDNLYGKSESEVRKSIEKKLQKQLDNMEKHPYFDPYFSNKGTFEFGIDGVDEYSDSAPLTIEYDPEKRKVAYFYYT